MLDRKVSVIEVTSFRPVRDIIITKDEITELTIDLNTLEFEDFIEKYW